MGSCLFFLSCAYKYKYSVIIHVGVFYKLLYYIEANRLISLFEDHSLRSYQGKSNSCGLHPPLLFGVPTENDPCLCSWFQGHSHCYLPQHKWLCFTLLLFALYFMIKLNAAFTAGGEIKEKDNQSLVNIRGYLQYFSLWNDLYHLHVALSTRPAEAGLCDGFTWRCI